jgi:hypothetical protein
MACPNFKNGQKNGLGPLGVKVYDYGNSFYLCLRSAKLCKLQLWCPMIWKSIWKFTWFVKNKGHQYWGTLCTLEQVRTSQQASTPWCCTFVPPQPITIALGLKVHLWFKITKVSKIWIAALIWETALGNTYGLCRAWLHLALHFTVQKPTVSFLIVLCPSSNGKNHDFFMRHMLTLRTGPQQWTSISCN